MKIPNWIKKNWLRIALGVLGIVLLFLGLSSIRSCDEAAYLKNIAVLDEEISGLKKKNVELEGEAVDYVTAAIADEKIVAGLENEVATSKTRIQELEKEEEKVEQIVMALPPPRLVENLQKVLKCEEILLNEDGILFSVECARQGLLKLEKFSLVERKYNEALFALSKSEKALIAQKRVSWSLYGALWKLGDVVLNLKVIVKRTETKFTKSEKQRKKGFLKGVLVGVAIGGGITVTFVIVIPVIKAIF